MTLLEIQSFRQLGKRLREAREMRSLTLPVVAGSCGLAIQEIVRIENGELLGFKQAPESTLTNAQIYAKALEVELEDFRRQHSGIRATNAQNDEVYIPAFLRKK
ncbi:helix-turn-helix domain-containing protein [Polynucleobacter yangtzensis]|jgi:cytoskeletal protein RodZ|uniref:helix-turn-helix domain-containing protein n=1 Tax=Polynucleobacter yangtzensis TaxID=1743159 RepID=UPI0008358350|nr:helix-turn-helix domain-containing protein [Polynucleobacter yangtzensis]